VFITCPWVILAIVLLPTIEPQGFAPLNCVNTELVHVSKTPVVKSLYENTPIDP
jgi:hypothetical protein